MNIWDILVTTINQIHTALLPWRYYIIMLAGVLWVALATIHGKPVAVAFGLAILITGIVLETRLRGVNGTH